MAGEGGIDLESLLGREREVGWLGAALQPGKASLVLGPKGVGKTALLLEARRLAAARGLRAGWASLPVDLRTAVGQLAESLGVRGPGRGRGQAAGRALLARLLGALRSGAPCAVLVDDGDVANEAVRRVLRRIVLETEAALLVAARTGPHEDPDRLRRAVLSGGDELHVEPLRGAPARALALRRLPPDRASLADDVARLSRGFPAAIVGMARRCTEARYLVSGKVSLQLILGDLCLENRV